MMSEDNLDGVERFLNSIEIPIIFVSLVLNFRVSRGWYLPADTHYTPRCIVRQCFPRCD